ncbi:Uncharacterised protein [Mycobacteroides abscessus]|nr:Uncharacterised protein [Mycobacteroides abscessus]
MPRTVVHSPGVAFAHASVVTPAPQSPTRLKRTCAGPEA